MILTPASEWWGIGHLFFDGGSEIIGWFTISMTKLSSSKSFEFDIAKMFTIVDPSSFNPKGHSCHIKL